MHSLPFGNGVAAGCCCQWCNDRRNDLRDGCLVRCNLKILVSIHDLRVWHSKLKDAWGSASWQGMIVKTSSCFAFWTRSGIFQSNLLFEDWVWDNSEWKQKVDMGPATVCSCEHRSTNVPVLSFHKLRGTSEASMGGTCLVVFDFFLKKQVPQGLIFAQARLQWVTPKLLVFVPFFQKVGVTSWRLFFPSFSLPCAKSTSTHIRTTLHPELYTWHSTIYMAHFTLYTRCGRVINQPMKWLKFLNVSIPKQDYMILTATWFTNITL